MKERMTEQGKNLETFGIDKFADRVSHSRFIKGLLLGTAVVAVTDFLNACTPQPAETAPMPSGTASAESPYVKYTPTTEATQVVTSVATPTRPDMAGGAYSAEEQSLIEKGTFKDTEDALKSWFKYWAGAANNPFHPETTDIHFKYVFDSSGKSAGVCMESSAYSGLCFALPIINGEVAKVPPTTSGKEYTIPVGYGPLQLSDQLSASQVSALKLDESLTGSILGYQDGGWVRIKNGEAVATLDLVSAQWKEKSLIEGNIFQDPQTEADFATVVESPSPIDKPSDFAKWQDEYLRQIDEKLKTYTGPSIDSKKIMISFENSRYLIDSDIWPVISSYKFIWNGKEILTKTYVVKDGQNNLIPISVTYTTSDSPAFYTDMGYKTPTGKAFLYLYYAWTDSLKSRYTDIFLEKFMPVKNDNLDAQSRVWSGTGTSSDLDIVKSSRFFCGGFGN
ncbi:MAG: hypothetical protein WC784_00950 [Candidatus Shapirobacteria bacterium]|jgi:hypothetical protein